MAARSVVGGKTSIEEIAQALGVSKTTVSRALSGKGRIGAETRARVFEYVGNAGAETAVLANKQEQGTTHNICLVIPKHFMKLDLPFLRKCMGGVCNMAAQRGYDVLLCYVSSTDTVQLERQLASHKVDGVILSRTMTEDASAELLHQYGVPYVAIGRVEDKAVPQADNDQIGAACEMTQLLLMLGMKRIAYLGGSVTYTVNADRLRGYLRALAEFGIKANQRLIYSGIESDAQRLDVLESVLEQRPECLLCCDDSLAYHVMQELRTRRIKVPEEICLASLYDSELISGAQPSISAVQFDAERLGATACRMLLDILAGKEPPPRQVQGYQVILRESTKRG